METSDELICCVGALIFFFLKQKKNASNLLKQLCFSPLKKKEWVHLFVKKKKHSYLNFFLKWDFFQLKCFISQKKKI